MKMTACILLLPVITIPAGCTRRSRYEGLRNYQELECDRMHGREREECLRRAGMSHDEYQPRLKERDK